MSNRLALALLALAVGSAVGACAPGRSWEQAPLAPKLHFVESVAPGTIVVLVTDAHSGAPLSHCTVTLPERGRGAPSDSLGRARLATVPPGEHRVLVRRLGYESRVDTVTVEDARGVVMLVQLRRTRVKLDSLVVGRRSGPTR